MADAYLCQLQHRNQRITRSTVLHADAADELPRVVETQEGVEWELIEAAPWEAR